MRGSEANEHVWSSVRSVDLLPCDLPLHSGFSTDGTRYEFFLSPAGWYHLAVDVSDPSDLKLAYSWVVAQLMTMPYAEKVEITANFEKRALPFIFDVIHVFEEEDDDNTVSFNLKLPDF